MLMEYVPGGDFFSHLRAAKRFNLDTTRFYCACIVLALAYCHKQKVVYRDLKPENLLLDSKGGLKITDFGLAKSLVDRCVLWLFFSSFSHLRSKRRELPF